MFYSSTNRDNSTLAQALQDAFVAQLQPENKREIKQCGKELFLCYFSENPTVMAECGFLSNAAEERLLLDAAYQTRIAQAICQGVEESCLYAVRWAESVSGRKAAKSRMNRNFTKTLQNFP